MAMTGGRGDLFPGLETFRRDVILRGDAAARAPYVGDTRNPRPNR